LILPPKNKFATEDALYTGYEVRVMKVKNSIIYCNLQ